MFKRGKLALNKFGISADYYVCPICTNRFFHYDPSVLTLEHIPAEKIGGKKLLLTCKECNNGTGGKLQSHQIEKEKQDKFWKKELSENINLEVETEKGILRGFVKFDDSDPPTFQIQNDRLHPDMRDFDAKELDQSKLYKLGRQFDWHTARIADLRDAYLIMFTKFGYSFVGWGFYDWIRKSIRDGQSPTDRYKWSLFLNDPFTKEVQKKYGSPIIFVTDVPKNAMIVARGTSGCLMPTPLCLDPYSYLGDEKASITINTKLIYQMPKKMELDWDFNESIVLEEQNAP